MIYLLLLFAAGALLPFQAGMNAELARHTSTVWSTVLSFAAGLPLLATLALINIPKAGSELAGMASVPWWGWIGGIFGTMFVIMMIFCSRNVSAAPLTAAVIAGQLCSALLVEHHGWVGFAKQEISLVRVAGVGFLLLGVWCVTKS